MRPYRRSLAALCLLGATAPALAADPSAVQAPIKGSDVMGDKNRTGPDGWSWAPQTRDQVPDADAKNTPANLNSQGSPTSPRLKPGEDPGTPAVAATGPASKP